MKSKPISPRLQRDLPPFFHEIGWRKFQRLCNELFSHEPDISKSDEYGIPGQRQHGIDLIALRQPSGIEVAQCKCEASFSTKKIRAAADTFLAHWALWKNKDIRRFILMVPCDVDRTDLHAEVLKQRSRFEKRAITFELWGATTIRNKLRPYRTIAATYIDSEEIVTSICGPVVESEALQAGAAVVIRRLGVMTTELEEVRSEELEHLRELSRAGLHNKALQGVRELKQSAAWSDYRDIFKARVLRAEAAFMLNLRLSPDSAAQFVDEAKRLDPTGDFQIIDAYLAYCRQDRSRALDILAKPNSVDAQNFRWNLLLELSDIEAIVKESADNRFPLDAETHRILALVSLARGNIAAAQFEVADAVHLGAARRNVGITKATVDYFSALSPAAEAMGKTIFWAVPVSWSFVKRDAASIAALQAAEEEFSRAALDSECSKGERENLRIWRLACLSCLEARQTEAAALAQQILTDNPMSSGAIAWALYRNYSFDRVSAEAALRKHVESQQGDINSWLALWSLVFHRGKEAEGEAIVDAAESTFRDTGNRDLWLFHKVQFLARRKQSPEKLINEILNPDLRRQASLAASRPSSSRSARSNLKVFADSLADHFEQTRDPRRLFECCDLKLQLGDFAFIAAHAKQLIEGVRTAASLRLALDGTFKHGDFAQCLSLLEDYRHLLRDGELSPDLRSLKAVCLHELGNWSQATDEAARNYHAQRSIGSFAAYFDLLARSGDTRQCSVLASDLLTLKGAKPFDLLRAAEITRLHDQELAKELWRSANRSPIKNLKLAASSLHLAFALGIPDEARTLFDRLTRLAKQGRGPLRIQSFAETIALLHARRETIEKTDRLYKEGAIPIHLLVEHLNLPLVAVFRAQLESNRAQANLLHSPPLFARSGARPIQSISRKSLFVDVTSLLLAEDVEILDQVEATFRPIYLSRHTPESLREQIARVYPSQPERHQAREKLLELVRRSNLMAVESTTDTNLGTPELRQQLGKENLAVLEHATNKNGLVLHDGPFLAIGSDGAPLELPPDLAALVISSVAIQNQAVQGNGPAIVEGTAIFIPHSMVACLPPNVLEAASKKFRLAVTVDTVRELESEVLAFNKSVELANWTQKLLDRIQRGIGTGAYKVVNAAPLAEDEVYLQSAPATQALRDSLAVQGLPEGVTWCDDRMVTHHLRAGNRIVVGVSDVLTCLRNKHAITDDQYFSVLLKLREGNVRYLPIAPGEIEHHLAQASIRDGHLLETKALATVRRYINTCMLDRGTLQTPTTDAEGNTNIREYQFVMGLRQSIDLVLQRIWRDQNCAHQTRAARSDWLLENIYFDLLGIQQAYAQPTQAGDVRNLVALSVGSLYGEGIGLDFRIAQGEDQSPRRSFFDWLDSRILEPLQQLDPAILALVGDEVSKFIIKARARPRKIKPEYLKVEKALWARFIADLPKALQDELDLPVSIQSELGISRLEYAIQVGQRIYDYSAYWQAMAEAVNEGEGMIQERDTGHQLRIRFAERKENFRFIVELQSDDPAETGRQSRDALAVIRNSVEERVQFMKARHHWFDCGSEKETREIQRIALIEAPEARFDALDELRASSLEVSYRRLATLLSQRGTCNSSDLYLSDWQRLFDHLRLPLRQTVEEEIKESSNTLYAEEGLHVALTRMMCLPRRVVPSLESHWLELSNADAKTLFKKLRAGPRSFVTDLHLVRLAAIRMDAELLSEADTLLERLFGPTHGRQHFDLFQAILGLVEMDFKRWTPGQKLEPWTRLIAIWYHASRLHGILRNPQDPLRFTAWLIENTTHRSEEIFSPDKVFTRDLARANNVTHGNLLLHGLANLIGMEASACEQLGVPQKLKALVNNDSSVAGLLSVELAKRGDLRPNSLNSFLSRPSDAAIANSFGTALSSQLFRFISDETINALLQDLANSPGNAEVWAMLHAVIGQGDIPQSVEEPLNSFLKTVTFEELSQTNEAMLGPAISFACYHARAIGDTDLLQRMEEAVMRFASLAPQTPDAEDNRAPLWAILANALLPLSIIPGNEEQSARRFFDLLRKFVQLCPKAADNFATGSIQWPRRLPLSQQVNLWPFIFTVRAIK